jgi:rhamnulose-1-phosphate aldolase
MTGGLETALNKIKETARAVYERGWGEATAGNMSIRLKDAIQVSNQEPQSLSSVYPYLSSKTIVITSSGSRMRQIAAGNPEEYCSVITLNCEGNAYYFYGGSKNAPSSELSAHLSLHNYFCENNIERNSILHCHPDEIIALMHLNEFKNKKKINKMLYGIHTEAQMLIPEGIGLVGELEPGSEELAKSILEEMRKSRIVLIERHGCISTGKNLDETLDLIEFVNKADNIYFKIKSIG